MIDAGILFFFLELLLLLPFVLLLLLELFDDLLFLLELFDDLLFDEDSEGSFFVGFFGLLLNGLVVFDTETLGWLVLA